jgi:iron(III) transport system ATP-binding protein
MIKVDELGKKLNDTFALSGISFQVNSGEALALVGPSGGGKTTLLRLIAGLEVPDSGNIYIDDKLVSSAGYACPPHERGIGMVFQKAALWPHMTLAQNVRFGLKGLNKTEAANRVRELFEITHLKGMEGRYPHQVSGGEAQRAALARAVAPKPNILFMDEPMTGLDSALVSEMNEVLREIRNTSTTTIIYVSHDLKEARYNTDRVIQLTRGRVTFDGGWESLDTKGN